MNKQIRCYKCGETKDSSKFFINRTRYTGFSNKCKECWKEYNKKYRASHIEQAKLAQKEWRENNKEYGYIYRQNNKDKLNEYIKTKRQYDPLFKFYNNTRNLIYCSFKRCGHKKNLRSEEILGCTIEFFRSYIESKFTEGMSLDNYGKWHLDHIIPLATAKTEEDVIRLCHYTNYQPLWAIDNLIKKDKIL